MVQFPLLSRLGINLRDHKLVVECHLDEEAFLQLFELGFLVVQGDFTVASWASSGSTDSANSETVTVVRNGMRDNIGFLLV